MANYDQDIITASLDELNQILEWIERNENVKGSTVLVGGWAVYLYNKWYGSIDIDLVVNRKTRKSLMHHLLEAREYKQDRQLGSIYRLLNNKRIYLDFAGREEEYPFEGRKETMNFDMVDGHTVPIDTGTTLATVPERSLLLAFKLKAAWDRSTRINECRSLDAERDMAKFIKDKADVLALLDIPDEPLNLELLAEVFRSYPFLVGVFKQIGPDPETNLMYGRISLKRQQELVEKTLALVM